MGEARKAIISLGAMVDRLLGRKGSEVEKAGPMNIQTGPRGGRYYVAKTGEKVYVDKNGQPVSGGDGGKTSRVSYKPGSKVRVSDGSGPNSNQVGVVVDQSLVKTDARGNPTNVENASGRIDWSKEVVVKMSDGKLLSFPKGRLFAADSRTEAPKPSDFTWGRTGLTASPHKPKDPSTGFHGSVSQTLGSSVVTPDYKKIQADYQAALESYTRHPSKEELADLQKAVSRMSEHLQKPVVHHELAGKAYHEIIQRMVSQGMVKSDNEARAVLDGREGNSLAQYMKPDHLQNQKPEDRVNQMLKHIQSGGFDETLETAIKFHREAQSGEKTDSAHKSLLIDESRPGRRVLSLNAMSLDRAEKAEPAKRGTPKEPEAKEPPPQAYQPASDKKVPASGGDDPIAEVNAQLLNAFRAWNAQRDGGQSANAPEWAAPASPQETPWQFAQRAAVELGKTDAGQAVQEEYGSGREWIDYVALTLKASGEKTSRVEGTTPAPANPATPPPPSTDEVAKGDRAYLTGPEAVEFILWEVGQKAKDWCEWKRGNNNVAGEPCYCSPAEALAEETRRKNQTVADAAENRAKNYLCEVSWGSDTHIRAMREIGGLSAFRDKLIEVFLATVATENAVAPVPGCDATVPVVEPTDAVTVAFPDQV